MTGALLLALLGQVSPAPSVPNWGTILGQLLVSSPFAALLFWYLQRAFAEIDRLHNEIDRLHREARENQDKRDALAERAYPALVEATRTLESVRGAMEASARGQTPASTDVTRLLGRIEEVMGEMRRQKGEP